MTHATDNTGKPNVGDWSTRTNDDPNIGDVGTDYPFLVVGAADDAYQGYMFTPKGMSLVTHAHEDPAALARADGTSNNVVEPTESRADFEARIRAEATRDANTAATQTQNGSNQ